LQPQRREADFALPARLRPSLLYGIKALTPGGSDASPMPAKEGQMAKEWITVLRAADAAARWHVFQRRKGVAAEEVSVPKIRFCNNHNEVREVSHSCDAEQ
jgi:hypothetical protein